MLNRTSFRISAVAALALSFAAGSAAQTTIGPAHSAIGIENFGRINDNYYRGAQPRGRDFSDLAAFGIKTVIDLTHDGDASEPAAVASAGMNFHRIPMTTQSRPADEAVVQFLKLVSDPANFPVYVHCQGGRHRTGVMTAIYRMIHDQWTAERAYQEMLKYEFNKGFGHGALKAFVYDYYTKLRQATAAASQ
jgi:protein tyrosine/serine phosphatase